MTYIVSDISPSKSKDILYVRLSDGGWFKADAKSEAVSTLYPGAELSDEQLAWWRSHKGLSAMETAGLMLGKRSYCSSELTKKLIEKGFSPNEAQETTQRICGYGLIDDRQYASDLIDSLLKRGKSKRVISQDLRSRGIECSLIEDLLSSVSDNRENVRFLCEKKYGDISLMDSEQKRKAVSWLCGKGFDYELIRSVLKNENDFD